MPLKFFAVPVADPDAAAEEVNKFVRTQKVVSIDRALVQNGASSIWTVCVQYTEGVRQPSFNPSKSNERIDYREVLGDLRFPVYAALRSLRQQFSESDDVPAYAVFTNAQLGDMVLGRVDSIEKMRAISGIGDSRLSKYGEAFLTVLKRELPKVPLDAWKDDQENKQKKAGDGNEKSGGST